MITQHGDSFLSAADQAASIVEGNGHSRTIACTKLMSIRMALPLFASLQALTNKSGKSRSATIEMVMEVGIEEVWARLSKETREELEKMQFQIVKEELAANE